MPIRPENRARYPKDWPAISARIRERYGNRCEGCGVENGRLGGRSPVDGKFLRVLPRGEKMLRLDWPRPGESAWCRIGDRHEFLRIIRIVLTVAHLDHVPEHCDDDNLRAWCQSCHNRYDAKMRADGIRRRAHAAAGQRDLFV